MDAFRGFFEKMKLDAPAKELNELYEQLQKAFPDLAKATSKPAKMEALQAYEAAHPEQRGLIESEDQFYGVSRGKNRLDKYVQWVFIPAVKDAASEQLEARNTALGRLLERTVRSQVSLDGPVAELKREMTEKYDAVLGEHRKALQALEKSLGSKLQEWAHHDTGVNLDWQDANKAVSISKPLAQLTGIEGAFAGEIARFGHGFQRCFLFALLQELSGTGQKDSPRLLLGCEEPELYQHPPQARYLASLLRRLSAQDSQILVCSHSPYFVSGKNFEDIRVALRLDSESKITGTTFDEIAEEVAAASGEKPAKPGGIAAKVEQDMQSPLNEVFFATTRVLVEGLEDLAHISTYLTLLDKTDEFRRLGCHLVPAQGKSNMIQALAIVNRLQLPTFTLLDSDSNVEDDAKRRQHERDNTVILKLCGIDKPDPFPKDHLQTDRVVMWRTQIGDVVEADIGKDALEKIKNEVRDKYGIFVRNMHKNTLFISYVLAEAWEQGKKSRTLTKLVEDILTFARNSRKPAV